MNRTGFFYADYGTNSRHERKRKKRTKTKPRFRTRLMKKIITTVQVSSNNYKYTDQHLVIVKVRYFHGFS